MPYGLAVSSLDAIISALKVTLADGGAAFVITGHPSGSLDLGMITRVKSARGDDRQPGPQAK
jgi:hypothetical protein